MSDAATPTVPEVTPPAPVATPATPEVTPPSPEVVTLTKAEHDQLLRDNARGRSAQQTLSRLGNSGTGHFPPKAPVTPPSQEEMAEQAAGEDRKAERGILAIAADPAFRAILDADPTLRDLMLTNPLAVLPMLANDALDAEDAISLVKENLSKRKPAPVAPATPPAPTPATPPAPPAGGVNPQTDEATNTAVELARKNPNTERAIAGMIGARVGIKK